MRVNHQQRRREAEVEFGTNPFERPTPVPAAHHLVVGLPVTYGIGSDRYAETLVAVRRNGMEIVTSVLSPETIAARRAEIAAEPRESERWYLQHRLDHALREFTRRPDGRYRGKGATGRAGGSLTFGRAADYRDPSY